MQRIKNLDTLAGSLVSRVRDAIHDGTLPDGERVNEVHLAAELGVSRTPLREALNRLVSEQILTLRPRHGYYVPRMTLAGFEAEYGIRPILDVAALELAGLPDRAALDEIDRLNHAILAEQTIAGRIDADDAFHLTLVGHCPNPVLLDLIRHMMLRTRRYEFAYFRECRPFLGIADEHARIIVALRRGDLAGACDALRHNLTSGLGPTRAWLGARAPSSQT
ncbi:MAG: GntR family transcriptional regulator [Hyphomonas sp.]